MKLQFPNVLHLNYLNSQNIKRFFYLSWTWGSTAKYEMLLS